MKAVVVLAFLLMFVHESIKKAANVFKFYHVGLLAAIKQSQSFLFCIYFDPKVIQMYVFIRWLQVLQTTSRCTAYKTTQAQLLMKVPECGLKAYNKVKSFIPSEKRNINLIFYTPWIWNFSTIFYIFAGTRELHDDAY